MNILKFLVDNRYNGKMMSDIELDEVLDIIKLDCNKEDIDNLILIMDNINNKILINNILLILDNLK